MASLMEKVSTLISANLHYMVDQALKTNSMAIIDQYIRQVEDNLEDLEDAAATVGAEVRSIERKLSEFEQKADEQDRAINAFLVEGNETAAAAVQSRLNSTKRLVETYREQAERQRVEFRNLLDAKVKLERHGEILTVGSKVYRVGARSVGEADQGLNTRRVRQKPEHIAVCEHDQ